MIWPISGQCFDFVNPEDKKSKLCQNIWKIEIVVVTVSLFGGDRSRAELN